MSPLPTLTHELLIREALTFCRDMSNVNHESMIGVTDGKAVGTYVEHKFKNILQTSYNVEIGSSANGIDLPSQTINTDIKVTSVRQPQSSCPFKSARQKIFGLGYNIILFVYEKDDRRTNNITFLNCSFIEKRRTADYMTSGRLIEICKNGGNEEDIIGFLIDRNLPADEIELNNLAHEILRNPPTQGYLTISNALQWRLNYGRVLGLSENQVDGVVKII